MIGKTTFTIRGVITNEPGRRVGDFSLGPRVIVDLADLPAAGLLNFGSRARRVLLVKVAERQVAPLVDALREDFKDEFVVCPLLPGAGRRDWAGLRSGGELPEPGGPGHRDSRRHRGVERDARVRAAEDAEHRRPEVRRRDEPPGHRRLSAPGDDARPCRKPARRRPRASGHRGHSTAAGRDDGARCCRRCSTESPGARRRREWALVCSCPCSSPSCRSFRCASSSRPCCSGTSRYAGCSTGRVSSTIGLVGLALVGLAAWQAASVQVGAIVCAGFAVLAFALQWTGRLLVRALAPLARSRRFPLRHAVLHLSRPGNQTRVILLAVGLGAFFIVGVRSLQSSLLEEFSMEFDAEAPDMFLMDVQRDQAEAMRSFLSDPALGTGPFRLIPVLRARVTGVDGRETIAREPRRRARPRSRWRASTPSLTGRPSRPTSAWSTARSGTAHRPNPRCRWRRACAIDSRSTWATPSGSTSWAASSGRASRACGPWNGAIPGAAVSCSCSGRAFWSRRRRPSSRRCEGRRGPPAARSSSPRSCSGFPTCRSSIFSRS